MVNVIAGLIAYTYQEKKPLLNLTTEDLDSLQETPLLKDETERDRYHLTHTQ